MKIDPSLQAIIKSLAVSAQGGLAIPKDGLLRVTFGAVVLRELELRFGVAVIGF